MNQSGLNQIVRKPFIARRVLAVDSIPWKISDKGKDFGRYSSKQERDESQVSLWTGQSSTPTTVWVRLHQK